MSSHESTEESSTAANEQTCDQCSQPYSHETTSGPGRSKRSCSCDAVLLEVADDTENAFANVAIRALNATGDVMTAAQIHEGARGRLVADGGQSCAMCIVGSAGEDPKPCRDLESRDIVHICSDHREEWADLIEVLDDEENPTTDGSYKPHYSCRHCDWAGDKCDRRDHYPVCPECSRIVDVRQELVADGGRDTAYFRVDGLSPEEIGEEFRELANDVYQNLREQHGDEVEGVIPVFNEAVEPQIDADETRCAAEDCGRPMDPLVHGVVLDGVKFDVPTCGGHQREQLATDGGQEIAQGKLEAARSAGAHDEFIAFVAKYPESKAAETLETAISLNALDDFPGHAGSFGGGLWEHGAKKASNSDTENRRRIEAMFDEDRWPEWMRQEASEEDLVSDVGVPESFDELASTCENCSEDVKPERLIEGECPGCHYHEPVADGGIHTVTRNGQEFAVVLQQELDEDADLDIGPSGVIRNHDEVEKHTTIRLLSVDAIRAEELWNRVIGPKDPEWEDEYSELELGESIVLDDEEPVADGGVSWYELHAFKRDILRVLAQIKADGDTSYGLAIKRRLEDRYGEEVNHGRLYPNLDDLIEFGLIEKSQLDKRTNRYTLTDVGSSMLRRQKEAWSELPVPEAVAMADGGDGQ